MTIKCFIGYFVALSVCSVTAFCSLSASPLPVEETGAAMQATYPVTAPHVRRFHRIPASQWMHRLVVKTERMAQAAQVLRPY